MYGLPTPFKKFIPRIYHDDTVTDNLADKADEHLEAWGKDVIDIQRFIRPDECPAWALDELGYFLAAGVRPNDTDRIKRRKIRTAISRHKLRGSWIQDAKGIIDAITGFESRIIRIGLIGTSDVIENDVSWIMQGQPPVFSVELGWGSMGCDLLHFIANEEELGLHLLGDGTEVYLQGNIYIDVGTSALTTAEIENLVLNLATDVVPAYFVVYLGYVGGSFPPDPVNSFVTYPGGIIG